MCVQDWSKAKQDKIKAIIRGWFEDQAVKEMEQIRNNVDWLGFMLPIPALKVEGD